MRHYYIDMVLPLGLRSSPKLFNMFADGLEYIMKSRGVTVPEHYLDDYFTAGPPGSRECEINLQMMKIYVIAPASKSTPKK